MISGVLLEWTRRRRPRGMADESIGSFISRRFNSQIADNLASALFHGIYAGDIYSLSAASIMPGLWFSEGKFGSLTAGILGKLGDVEDYSQARDLYTLNRLSKSSADRVDTTNASVFSFRQGMQTLPLTLERRLRKLPNVEVKCNTAVKRLEFHPDGVKVSQRLSYELYAKLAR
jgi:protoporphyrinogen oxidase